MSEFIAYIGDPGIHDAQIVAVARHGTTLTVGLTTVEGRGLEINFFNVDGIVFQEPVGKTVYSLSELAGDLSSRRFAFTSSDDNQDVLVDIRASEFECRGPRTVACPCCRHITLDESGAYDICPVCFWEDDGQGDAEADEVWGGPNGDLSLTTARRNFAAFGASDDRSKRFVRRPLPWEVPRSR